MVNDQPGSWPELSLGSTPKSGFKSMIITIFILILTQVNGQLDPSLIFGLKLILESGFKSMIITIFILALTRVNGPNSQP
jgi:hypothetical protein